MQTHAHQAYATQKNESDTSDIVHMFALESISVRLANYQFIT